MTNYTFCKERLWKARKKAGREGKKYIMYLLLLLPLLLILSGCASGYSKFYNQRTDGELAYNLETLKENQTPIIVKTNDLWSEVERYLSKNFSVIGQSHFNGEMESDENIISQAKDVKATIVVQTSSFVTTQLVSTPLFTPNGIGGLNATTINNQQMRYNQDAVFMAKRTKKPRFGAVGADLTPDQKKQYGRNTGVLISFTVEESPAFDANILPGDLLIGIGGNNVQNGEHAGHLLDAVSKTADKIIFKIIRNNIEKDIELSLK